MYLMSTSCDLIHNTMRQKKMLHSFQYFISFLLNLYLYSLNKLILLMENYCDSIFVRQRNVKKRQKQYHWEYHFIVKLLVKENNKNISKY